MQFNSQLPTNVTIDPRDKRIDFGAKFALQRILKKAETQLDAIRLIRGIDSGRLAGIHGDAHHFFVAEIAHEMAL